QLADRLVRTLLETDGFADLGRQRLVDAITANLAGTDRSAPDVDLRLVVAAQIDAAVAGVIEFFHLRSFVSIRVNDRTLGLLRLRGETPIADHHEVAELFLGPQVPVVSGRGSFGFAVAVVIQNPI